MDIAKLTIKQIEEKIHSNRISSDEIEFLRQDSRIAVKKLLKRWERNEMEILRVRDLYHYEERFYEKGLSLVAGIDEAGRGPLAGPVAVAAVILPPKLHIPKINDSKKLSAKVREGLYKKIIKEAVVVERCFIEPEVIDEINIYQATIRGIRQVLNALNPKAQAVLIDAVPVDGLPVDSLSLIKGDAKSASIAAASIVAKVERDRLMDAFDKVYPQYGFKQHKGYGTAAHLAAIRQYGPCPIHRKSFEPIKSWR